MLSKRLSILLLCCLSMESCNFKRGGQGPPPNNNERGPGKNQGQGPGGPGGAQTQGQDGGRNQGQNQGDPGQGQGPRNERPPPEGFDGPPVPNDREPMLEGCVDEDPDWCEEMLLNGEEPPPDMPPRWCNMEDAPYYCAATCMACWDYGPYHERAEQDQDWERFQESDFGPPPFAGDLEEAVCYEQFEYREGRRKKHEELRRENKTKFDMAWNRYYGWNATSIKQLTKLKLPATLKTAQPTYTRRKRDIPSSVDWRKGSVPLTDPKDQGSCGACWAFATIATLEWAYAKAKGLTTAVSLSEQHLIDCDREESDTYGGANTGCGGGYIPVSMEFVQNYGSKTLLSYQFQDASYNPSSPSTNACRGSATTSALLGITSHKAAYIDPVTDAAALERNMMEMVSERPVAVGIAAHDDLISYSSGIYDGNCASEGINHAVVIVGYGTDDDGTGYWIIRNSWSKDWGEGGYFRLIRDGSNHCSVVQYYGYPNL